MRLIRWPLHALCALAAFTIAETPLSAQVQLGDAFGEITLGATSLTGGTYSKDAAFFNAGGLLGGRYHQREKLSLLTALSFDRTINVANGDSCALPAGSTGGCLPEKPSASYIGLLFGVEPHCESFCTNFMIGPGLSRVGRENNGVKGSAKSLGIQAVAEMNLQIAGGVWLAVAAKGLSTPNFSDPSTSSYIKPHVALFAKSLSIGFRIQQRDQ